MSNTSFSSTISCFADLHIHENTWEQYQVYLCVLDKSQTNIFYYLMINK